MRLSLNNSRGVALTIVIIVIIMLTLISAFVTNLGYNQRRLMDTASGINAKAIYRAKAGAVHAAWRIRADDTAPRGARPGPNFTNCVPGGTFTNPAYTCAYSLDVDEDGTVDTTIVIGAVGGVVAGLRQIQSTGLDI